MRSRNRSPSTHRKSSGALVTVLVVVAFAVFYAGSTPGEFKAAETTCIVTTAGCPADGGTGLVTTTAANTTDKLGKPVQVALAYPPGCPHCEALNNFILNLSATYDLGTTYTDAIANQTVVTGYLGYCIFPQTDWGLPILFASGIFCVGDSTCISFLSSNIVSFAQTGFHLPTIRTASPASLTIIEITGLALVDSINPCAFAFLIFLLSTMFMYNPTKMHRLPLGGFPLRWGYSASTWSLGWRSFWHQAGPRGHGPAERLRLQRSWGIIHCRGSAEPE